MPDWTNPKTWAVNEVATSADLNTFLSGNTPRFYWKTTSFAVTNTVTETDLLHGEITLPGSIMGSNQRLRAWLSFDHQVSSGPTAAPRFKVKLGSTVCLDTGTGASTLAGAAGRINGLMYIEMQQQNATNAQEWTLQGMLGTADGASSGTFAVGTGWYKRTDSSSGPILFDGRNATTVDMTVSQAFVVTVINGTATNCETKLYSAKIVVGA